MTMLIKAIVSKDSDDLENEPGTTIGA